jgi:hypothetical protein
MLFLQRLMIKFRTRRSNVPFGPLPTHIFTDWVHPDKPWHIYEFLVERPVDGALEIIPARYVRRTNGKIGQIVMGLHPKDTVFRWVQRDRVKGFRMV